MLLPTTDPEPTTTTTTTTPLVRTKSNRHRAALRCLETAIQDLSSSVDRTAMSGDYKNLERLGNSLFLAFLAKNFEGFRCYHKATAKLLADFSTESHRRANDSKMITTSVVVMTPNCPLCHQEHHGYQVKLDKGKTQYPYVVCGTDAKRIAVRFQQQPPLTVPVTSTTKATLANLKDLMYAPNFVITGGAEEDIVLVTRLSTAVVQR